MRHTYSFTLSIYVCFFSLYVELLLWTCFCLFPIFWKETKYAYKLFKLMNVYYWRKTVEKTLSENCFSYARSTNLLFKIVFFNHFIYNPYFGSWFSLWLYKFLLHFFIITQCSFLQLSVTCVFMFSICSSLTYLIFLSTFGIIS